MPHRSALYLRWALEMRKRRCFRAGGRMGVAVSGGPDSTLLLDFMHRFAREAALTLAAVHFNHKLRGKESEADENFVRELARELGIEFLRSEPGSAEAARPRHRNLEAAARDLRYRFFFSLMNSGKLDAVVTGHTADDQAETVLLRLLRGSGTRGLGGIYPMLSGRIFRPFLSLPRNEIERELRERKLSFRLDSSNQDVRFQRNRIRHELMPLLLKEYNPECVSLLGELAERSRDEEEALERWSHERALPWLVKEGEAEKIPVRALADFPVAVQRRVLRQMIQTVKGSLQGITHRSLEALRHLALENQSGRSLSIPGRVEARREFDWLIVAPRGDDMSGGEYYFPVQLPGEIAVLGLGTVFHFKLIAAEARGKSYNEARMGGLDPQKLSGTLTLRNWRHGDRYWPLGARSERKLKELLGRQKIPASQRKVWPVLESGEKIVWVRGFPPSGDVAATPGSKQVVVIEESIEPAR